MIQKFVFAVSFFFFFFRFDSDIRWMEQLKKLQNDRGFTFDKLDDSVVQRIMNRMDGSIIFDIALVFFCV
jgi:hypothetical protein